MQTNTIRPFVLGIMMTDEWAASPNMGEPKGDGQNQRAAMKSIRTAEGTRTLISGQSIGSWHRATLYDRFGWDISELQETISGRDTRQFYTQCQPIEFAEDDGRGYLAAVTIVKGSPLTTKRTSPFMLSQFQSLAAIAPTTEFGILARGLEELPEESKGNMIFQSELAAASYAGMFALNCSELGVFTVGAGRDLLPLADLKKGLPKENFTALAKSEDKRTKEDNTKISEVTKALKRCVNLERGAMLALPAPVRQQRAHDLVAAMGELEGGALMTRRLYNVAPASALIAFMDGGNCLPPYVFRAVRENPDLGRNSPMRYEVDIERLWKILKDNATRFLEMGENGFNLFFGTLGAPTIANEAAVRDLLEGKDEAHPLPPEIKAKVCDGPREAVRYAADSIPQSWFAKPEKAIEVTSDLAYGEQLLPVLGTEVPGAKKEKTNNEPTLDLSS